MFKFIKVRKELGISQYRLAKLTGINQPVLCNIERGRVYPWPKYRKLIAEALNADEDGLFDEIEED